MSKPLIAVLLFTPLAAAQITVGTRSADDHSRENATNAKITAAESSLEAGNFDEAAKILRDLATERPKDARILYDLGFAEDHLNHDDAAAGAYAKSIAADPTLAEPQISLALLDARDNRLSKAHDEFEKVAKSTDASPVLQARALRALAQLDADTNPTSASDELLAAIKLTGEQPGDADLTAHLAEKSGDTKTAAGVYGADLKANPSDVDAAIGLARSLKASGKFPEAEAVLTDARNASPANSNDVRIIAQLATVYVAEGKDAQAIPLLEDLRKQDPKAAADPVLAEMLARMYAMNNRGAEAESIYREILAKNPNDPGVLDSLGGVLVKELKSEEAVDVLKKAVSNRVGFHDDQAWAEAASHLAFAASRANQPQLCLQAIQLRDTILPSSPSSLFLQATAHDKLRQNKLAIDEYKAFLTAAKDNYPDETFEARHRIIALENEHH